MSDNKVEFIQLSNYNRPPIREEVYNKWVLNGENNQYYEYIIDRFNGSPTNAAIIDSYVNFIYGKGMTSDNPKAMDLLDKLISKKDVRKIVFDFYLFGEARIQKIRATNSKELPTLSHLATNDTAPAINEEEGDILGYWFCKDWNNKYKFQPVFIPNFGTDKENELEVLAIKPYKAGKHYFSDPVYTAAMPYAEMEEEIANLNINAIKKGLSAGYIVNVPNGGGRSEEEKAALKKAITEKLAGSPNAGTYVINYHGVDAAITIEPFPVNDKLHKQWEFLVGEARQQLLTGHKVTSPMLFGIKDNTGLGNNADEMEKAESTLMRLVIPPLQNQITDAFNEIAEFYGVTDPEYYFIPLQEAKDEEEKEVVTKELQDDEIETGLAVKKKCNSHLLTDLGEDIDFNEWDVIYDEEVDYEEEEKIQLASTGTARPNSKSAQDGENFIVRYRFVGSTSGEREFCNKMMSANKVYRKEDILQMGNKPVNAGWGPKGADTYSIWLYKGGGNCHHKWNRVIFLKKGANVDVNSPLAKMITTGEARRRGYKIKTNDTKVSIEPHKMDYNGFLPTNKRFN